MANEANSASNFPTDPGSTGNQGNDLSLVVAATPEVLDEVGFSSIPRSFANAASQTASTQLRSLAQVAPAVLHHFIGDVDFGDSETRRLNDKILALEQAKSDLLVENAVLIGDVDSRDSEARSLNDKIVVLEQTKSALLVDNAALIGDIDSRDSETRRLNDKILVLERAKSDLLVESAALIGDVDSRDSETRRLNDKILVLEQAKSDLLVEIAVLASAIKAPDFVVAATSDVLDEEEFSWIRQSFVNSASQNTSIQMRSLVHAAPAVLDDFIGGANSRDSETRRLDDEVVVFEHAKSDLRLESEVLASAPKASKRESNFAKILIVLGGLLAGFGFHLFGSQIGSRESGIALMAIGVGLGLMNHGWFSRPKGE